MKNKIKNNLNSKNEQLDLNDTYENLKFLKKKSNKKLKLNLKQFRTIPNYPFEAEIIVKLIINKLITNSVYKSLSKNIDNNINNECLNFTKNFLDNLLFLNYIKYDTDDISVFDDISIDQPDLIKKDSYMPLKTEFKNIPKNIEPVKEFNNYNKGSNKNLLNKNLSTIKSTISGVFSSRELKKNNSNEKNTIKFLPIEPVYDIKNYEMVNNKEDDNIKSLRNEYLYELNNKKKLSENIKNEKKKENIKKKLNLIDSKKFTFDSSGNIFKYKLININNLRNEFGNIQSKKKFISQNNSLSNKKNKTKNKQLPIINNININKIKTENYKYIKKEEIVPSGNEFGNIQSKKKFISQNNSLSNKKNKNKNKKLPVIKSLNNLNLNKINTENNKFTKKEEIIPSGNNFDIMIPSDGVIITNLNKKSKKGNFNFHKIFNKMSTNQYSKILNDTTQLNQNFNNLYESNASTNYLLNNYIENSSSIKNNNNNNITNSNLLINSKNSISQINQNSYINKTNQTINNNNSVNNIFENSLNYLNNNNNNKYKSSNNIFINTKNETNSIRSLLFDASDYENNNYKKLNLYSINKSNKNIFNNKYNKIFENNFKFNNHINTNINNKGDEDKYNQNEDDNKNSYFYLLNNNNNEYKNNNINISFRELNKRLKNKEINFINKKFTLPRERVKHKYQNI